MPLTAPQARDREPDAGQQRCGACGERRQRLAWCRLPPPPVLGAPAGVLGGVLSAWMPSVTFTVVDGVIVVVTVDLRTQTTTETCCAWTVTVNRAGGRIWSVPAASSGSGPLMAMRPLPAADMFPASGTLSACAPVTGRAPLNETADVPAG